LKGQKQIKNSQSFYLCCYFETALYLFFLSNSKEISNSKEMSDSKEMSNSKENILTGINRVY